MAGDYKIGALGEASTFSTKHPRNASQRSIHFCPSVYRSFYRFSNPVRDLQEPRPDGGEGRQKRLALEDRGAGPGLEKGGGNPKLGVTNRKKMDDNIESNRHKANRLGSQTR